MEDEENIDVKRKVKLNQIRANLILSFTKNKAEKFFNQKMYNNVDRDTLFILCLPCFMKSLEERDRNDYIMISIFLYQIKKFIDLFKHNMLNLNEKLDSKFFDSLRFISSNIMYTKFNSNRLLMRYGEEGKKFYLSLKGDVAILIPIKKIVSITINEYKRYIALLIIYKEYKLLLEVLKENNVVYDMDMDFFEDLQNYEKNIDLLQSINLFNKDEEEPEKDKYKKDLTQLLDLYLTTEEKKFYNKYVVTKKRKYQEEKDDGIFLSPREYIKRINLYSDFDFETLNQELDEIKRETRLKKLQEEGSQDHKSIDSINLNETKTFLIYDYHRVTELGSGEMFGDQALSSATSQRTATIITITECHLGYLNDETYAQSIKEYKEKNRRNRICYLCNVPIMSTFSYKLIEKRYYNNFVFKGAKRKEIILTQNQKNKNIILFKEGTYEISFKGTIADISDIINLYMRQYELIVRRKSDINEELSKNVFTMNRQRKKIERLFYNDINKEYDNKIFLVNAPNIFGMAQTEKEEFENDVKNEKNVNVLRKIYVSFYEIKCYSLYGEYVLLDKKLFDEEIMRDDKAIIAKKNGFLKEFYEKIIKRLLVIRYGKIWNLFLENGIYNENNGVNIDWNKIELNQNFIKGIIKLIDVINEYKFLSNDLDKDMNKYFEERRIKSIEEKQKLKYVYNNEFSHIKVQELLNTGNKSDLNFNLKGLTSNNFKYINPERKKRRDERIPSKRYNLFNINRRSSKNFNNYFNKNNLEKNKGNKGNKTIRKNFSFVPINKTLIEQSVKINIPGFEDKSKKFSPKQKKIINRNEGLMITLKDKVKKKEFKKRVTFYSPNLHSFHSKDNLKLHLYLYDTFKKFGESHTGNVVKKTKVVKYIKYEKKESDNED